ncbi:conjugal transfer protein TraE [Grimontia sp. SpTr1]|uniref:VirB4 family type IV secretion/conjugal transfer ATPase n=1 Tax=Grimontia sp. SpTr1 TaxID=2995319 RepID=UPI00248B1EA0|nr:conjugal transfer protein TraE [Grimontia sp. SpTr1]
MLQSGLKTIPIKGIPEYGRVVTKSIIKLEDKVLSTIEIFGIPYECEPGTNLQNALDTQKSLFNNLAKQYGSDLAVWTHIVNKKEKLEASYEFKSKFVNDFSNEYLKSFNGEDFFVCKYYLTFVYKHGGNLQEGVEVLEDIVKVTLSTLKEFSCKLLQVTNELSCEPAEFIGYLMNYKDVSIPLSGSKVLDSVMQSDWHFMHDMAEVRNLNSHDQKFATYYEIDSLPSWTEAGMWDFLLEQQTEFILSQSMILMRPNQSTKLIDRQINLIASTDNALQEIEDLSTARDYVVTGDIAFGMYHGSITVLADSQATLVKKSTDLYGEFLARGAVLKRANLKSPFTFKSSLPGAKERVKASPKTVTNLLSAWSLHNQSIGKPFGNPIGDGTALIPLKTTNNTIFYLNCHASEIGKDVTGEPYAGHTMLLGASGTGKTTLEAVLTGFFTRFDQKIFCIDYKRSTELFIRAYEGEYFSIKEGVDTGINLFQLEKTPKLVSFLNRLVCTIAKGESNNAVTPQNEQEIKNAIDSVMNFEAPIRGLSLVLQSIQDPDLRLRLSKWCRSENGSLSWCLDSPKNVFDPYKMGRVGFDSTLLLEKDASGKNHPASEALLGCLFFLKNLMQEDGRLIQTIVEEFWMPASFPLTQEEMKRGLKTGRLGREFLFLTSQSPEDAINSPIFPAIIQQTATKIYLPNPDAEYKSYAKCNLTQEEFQRLQKLGKQSRTMLIKQSNTSCFAKMDLNGFDDFLPIISGSAEDIVLCEQVREAVGNDPTNWIPELLKKRNEV